RRDKLTRGNSECNMNGREQSLQFFLVIAVELLLLAIPSRQTATFALFAIIVLAERGMTYMRAPLSFLALAVALLLTGCGHHVSNYQFTNSSIEPSAAGRVQVSHDKNGNSVVNVRVYHLADPAQLAPPKAGYVVWEQPKGMPAKN